MPDQNLLNYIKNQQEKGVEKETIKNNLRANSWREEDIETAFAFLEKETTSNQSELLNPSKDNSNQNEEERKNIQNVIEDKVGLGFDKSSTENEIDLKMPKVSVVRKESLIIFKYRFWTLFGISAVSILPIFVCFAFAMLLGVTGLFDSDQLVGFLPVFIFFICLIIIFPIWASIASLYTLKSGKDSIGVFESYKRSFKDILDGVLVLFLTAFIVLVATSLSLGFLGIVAVILLHFTLHAFVLEGKRGFRALFASYNYVTKIVGWRTLLYFLDIALLYIVGVVVAVLLFNLAFGFSLGLMSSLLALLSGMIFIILYTVVPFYVLVYFFVVYNHAKYINDKKRLF